MPTSENSADSKLSKFRYHNRSSDAPKYSSLSYPDFLDHHVNMNRNKLKRIKSIKTNLKRPKENLDTTTNPWIMNGTLGSKDTVLMFRTCLLTNQHLDDHEHTISDSNSSLNVDKDSGNASSISKSFNVTSDSTLDENSGENLDDVESNVDETEGPSCSKKRPAESMSSSLSDQSLSSVSGDTTEIETVIQKLTDFPEEEEDNLENLPSESQKANYTKKVTNNSKEDLVSTENKENHVSLKSELPATLLRMCYRFQQTETRLLRKILSSHGFVESPEEENFNLLWTGVHIKPDILRNLAPFQRVNHFPRSYELTRKDSLHKNIEKMQHLRGFKHFDIVPQSFILPAEYKDLVSAHNKLRGPWIVKPVASSRGRGIFIVNSPDQIPVDEHVVVAKYIADPLCIDGHKCDIRLYVAVTSFNPLIIYIYEEGLVRIATVKYNRNVDSLWNPCMHLCNYSINKYHSDYIKSSDADEEDVGHKWTLSALLRHLKSQGCDTEQLMINIEDVIIKSIMSCTQPIVSACRMFVPNFNNCFELYGFDILIDDSLKPWLLEINLSPSLGIDSPLDAKVKSSLLIDLLTLVGIPALPPMSKTEYDQRFSNRAKNFGARRSISVDVVNTNQANTKTKACQITTLTAEEARIVKFTKSQFARRGGFVRVFPVVDTMQKYGLFMDAITGIPTSTMPSSGNIACPMIIPHNYNAMLHSQLYPNGVNLESRVEDRMSVYERTLELGHYLHFGLKHAVPKCLDEARRLRKQVRKIIENGNELSQLQARKAFGLYLEYVLKRLASEPKHHHEKLILKFIQRSGVNMKTPNFIRDHYNQKIQSKDRGAMVAKQLGDYLQIYNRETDTYVDSFDRYGMVPIKLFNAFLSQADEGDLESILTLHTNHSRQMPFLYNHCAMGVPPTPPIPTGSYGFLKALPSMAPNGIFRDDARIDSFYKSIDSKIFAKSRSEAIDKGDKSSKLNPLRKKSLAKQS